MGASAWQVATPGGQRRRPPGHRRPPPWATPRAATQTKPVSSDTWRQAVASTDITADPAGTRNVTAESCDTAQNEADRLMEWWDTRRKYMDLGEDSGAKGSDAAPLAGEEQGKSPVRRGRGITCADLLVQGRWLQCIGGCNGSICSTCAAGAFLGSATGDLILNNYLCYCRGEPYTLQGLDLKPYRV